MIDNSIKTTLFLLLMFVSRYHCFRIHFQNSGIKKHAKLRFDFICLAFSSAPPSQGYNGWNIDDSESKASKPMTTKTIGKKVSDYSVGRNSAISRPPAVGQNFATKASSNRFKSNEIYGRSDRSVSDFDSTLISKRNEGRGSFTDGKPDGRFNSYSNKDSTNTDRRNTSPKNRPGFKAEDANSRNSPVFKSSYSPRGNFNQPFQKREETRQSEGRQFNQFQSNRDAPIKEIKYENENNLEEYDNDNVDFSYSSSTNNDYEGGRREPSYGYFNGDHIYGVLPVRLALSGGRRIITELLIQEGMDIENKKDQTSVVEILDLAKSNQIPIREFSKHDLNMLTDSRPHQGFVLRAAPLQFQKITSLPPSEDFKCVLALDEVWDPQNLGALLRTCHFLACDGVVVCAKNSAPLSSSVSKASAGAMELMDISSTSNMMKFLDESRKNGWQIVGTALDPSAINLNALPLDKPTVLVLGNEGHGIRTNILRRCDVLVKIGAIGEGSGGGTVDSLNVSVTGGIMLHHILTAKKS